MDFCTTLNTEQGIACNAMYEISQVRSKNSLMELTRAQRIQRCQRYITLPQMRLMNCRTGLSSGKWAEAEGVGDHAVLALLHFPHALLNAAAVDDEAPHGHGTGLTQSVGPVNLHTLILVSLLTACHTSSGGGGGYGLGLDAGRPPRVG